MQNPVAPASSADRARAVAGRRLQEGLLAVALVGALGLLGWAGESLLPTVRTSNASKQAQNGAAWEGRRMLGQLYWLKTHAVMHAGAEERAARPGEEQTRAGEFHDHGSGGKPEAAESHDEHEAEGHHAGESAEEHAAHSGKEGGSVLVIPPAREDFRGLLGDLERAVKPYAAKDGKLFSKDVDQTLPYYQLITWVDPHHLEAYTIGATMIGRAGKYPDQAIAFLKDGEKNNPDSFEIQTELGRFYLVYKKEYATAERYLLRAVELAPKGKAPLREVQREERDDAYRWLALTYREWGKPEQARAIARDGLAVIGEDISLRAILKDARPGGIQIHPRNLPQKH